MTLLLNLLPLIITAIFWVFILKNLKNKKRAVWLGVGWIATLFILSVVQPSYLPKGKAPEFFAPPYEEKEEVTVQDRLLKTKKTPEQTEKDFKEMVDWRAAKAERENEKAEKAP